MIFSVFLLLGLLDIQPLIVSAKSKESQCLHSKQVAVMGKQLPNRLKEVVYTLSPFETSVMSGLWKDLPSKIQRKVSEVWYPSSKHALLHDCFRSKWYGLDPIRTLHRLYLVHALEDSSLKQSVASAHVVIVLVGSTDE